MRRKTIHPKSDKKIKRQNIGYIKKFTKFYDYKVETLEKYLKVKMNISSI